jgi:hypothetical protein
MHIGGDGCIAFDVSVALRMSIMPENKHETHATQLLLEEAH